MSIVSYTEDTSSDFPNPERGWYKTLTSDGGPYTSAQLQGFYATSNHSTFLYLLYLDAYVAVATIDSAFLTAFQNDLDAMRSAGVKCILRCSYDKVGASTDAAKAIMLGHIDQLAPIITSYSDVIPMMHMGFIGAHGEWESSSNFGSINVAALDYGLSSTQWSDRKAVVDRLLSQTPSTLMVALRSPVFKINMYGSTPIADANRYDGTQAHRLCAYNTAFCTTATDLGTYVDADIFGTKTPEAVANMTTSTAAEVVCIDPRYGWQRNSSVIQDAPRGDAIPSWWTGERPTWCYGFQSWYQVFEAQGNAATNTRVHVKNLRSYFLLNSTGQWVQVQSVTGPYTELYTYPFNYVGSQNSTGYRLESDGGKSFKPVYPNFMHGYPSSKYSIPDPSDVKAVLTLLDVRLIVGDPSQPDDREKAVYTINCGADFYPDATRMWNLGYAPGVGQGRFIKPGAGWRTMSMLVPNNSYYGLTYSAVSGMTLPIAAIGESSASEQYSFLEQDTKWMPWLGEANEYDPPRSDSTNAKSELALLHASLLASDAGTTTLNAWKTTGDYDVIGRSLGYRLYLASSDLPDSVNSGATASVTLSIHNRGYAAPFRNRAVKLVFDSGANIYSVSIPGVDIREWLPTTSTPHTVSASITLPAMAAGTYSVYLSIPDSEANYAGKSASSIRLANSGVWSGTTGYNSLNRTMTVAAVPATTLIPLSDNFDDNSIDSSKWVVSLPSANSTAIEQNKRMEIKPYATGSEYTLIHGVSSYDFTNRACFVRLVQPLNSDVNGADETFFGVADFANLSAGVRFRVSGTPLKISGVIYTGSGNTLGVTTQYSAATHAWLRMRFESSSGNFILETAPSTASDPPVETDWVAFDSLTPTFSATTGTPVMIAGNWTTTAAPGPGTAIYDGFNTGTTAQTIAVDASSGSYATTTVPAALMIARTDDIADGAFSMSGKTGAFSIGRTLAAVVGTVAMTGNDAPMEYGSVMGLSSSSYAMTGVAADLVYGTFNHDIIDAITGQFVVKTFSALIPIAPPTPTFYSRVVGHRRGRGRGRRR